jgi:hypothetical protein
MGVVVPEVDHQDRGQMSAAEDQDPVGAFAAEGADPAFGDGVVPRRRLRLITSLRSKS